MLHLVRDQLKNTVWHANQGTPSGTMFVHKGGRMNRLENRKRILVALGGAVLMVGAAFGANSVFSAVRC
jgi:hypothetical protein